MNFIALQYAYLLECEQTLETVFDVMIGRFNPDGMLANAFVNCVLTVE